MGPFRNPIQWSRREDDVLDKDREGLGMIKDPLVLATETRADDAVKIQPGQKMVKNRMWTDEVHTVDRRPLAGYYSLGVADLSCIHSEVIVY